MTHPAPVPATPPPNASRHAWALRICTIAFVICGTVLRWWWPVVVVAALLLVIDAAHKLADHLGGDT